MAQAGRMGRKFPIGIDKAVDDFIREMKIASGLNARIIFSAWDEVSGAAEYTNSRFFRDGILYIGLKSSVVRNDLYYRSDSIIKAINDRIAADPLFIKDDPNCHAVVKLVLK